MTPRIPPNSLEAEQSILGSMLVSQTCVYAAVERLTAKDFYTNVHRDIWSVMRALFDENKPIDIVTVVEKLSVNGELSLEELSYLNDLALRVPSTRNISSYIDIVKEKSVFRQLIEVCGDVADICFKSEMNSVEAINYAGDAFYNVASTGSQSSLVHVKTALVEGFDEIIRVANSGNGLMGAATGFPRMDRMLSGLQPSQLIIVAGRPGMGKTSFALNMAEHMAIGEGKTIAVFSLEMSREQLGLRLLCAGAGVNSSTIRAGRLSDKDYESLANAMLPIGNSSIYIDDTPAMGVTQMQAKLRQLKREHGDISMVIIDYLQLIATDGRTDNRVLQIGQITRALKIMARELGLPVVLLSQLSRASEKRENKQPMLSDLRDSGSIEQDADVVIFLHRDDYYGQNEENKGRAKIIIAKQRSGAVGTIDAVWNAELTKYMEIDTTHEEG